MSTPFSEYGPFEVGEICRVVYSKDHPEFIGREVEIISLPHPCRNSVSGENWVGYGTNIKNYDPPESYLRRRKPPTTGEQSVMQMFVDAPQRVEVPA